MRLFASTLYYYLRESSRRAAILRGDLGCGFAPALWFASIFLISGCNQEDPEPGCPTTTCGTAVRCAVSPDPLEPGPWAVGALTLDVSGLRTEVWYPAPAGSEAGQAQVVYDLRQELPLAEQAKIPDSDNPWQRCDCYRNLPLDEARGPYPVVVFLHGTAAFRTQSLSQVVHWASRGFVVVAADHPGLYLGDLLVFKVDSDLTADVDALLAALAAPAGPLAFLQGHLDLGRLAFVGHSRGGSELVGYGRRPGVRALIPMASGGVEPGPELQVALVMGGIDDQIVAYTEQQAGYASSPSPKHLVGIGNAGHLVFTDLCGLKNPAGKDLVAIAIAWQVKNAKMAGFLWDGCAPGQIDPADGIDIVTDATTAALEQALWCADTTAAWSAFAGRHPSVSEYKSDP